MDQPAIPKLCILIAAALALASCDRKAANSEDLEDRITELEEENQSLRDQLAEAKAPAAGSSEAGQQAADGAGSFSTGPYPAPPPYTPPPRRAEPNDTFEAEDEAADAAQSAAEAARDAEDAEARVKLKYNPI